MTDVCYCEVTEWLLTDLTEFFVLKWGPQYWPDKGELLAREGGAPASCWL